MAGSFGDEALLPRPRGMSFPGTRLGIPVSRTALEENGGNRH